MMSINASGKMFDPAQKFGQEDRGQDRGQDRGEKLAAELAGLARSLASRVRGAELFGEPLSGFADAADPLFGEIPSPGWRHALPVDILPSARSVMSIFLPFQREVVSDNRAAAASGRPAAMWAEATERGSDALNDISAGLLAYLHGRGIEAATVPATYGFDTGVLRAGWSHKSAAFIAGLGTFGLHRMLITARGCAGRATSVIFSEPVPYGAPRADELCAGKNGGSCRRCVEVCPIAALDIDIKDEKMGKNGEPYGRTECFERCLENERIGIGDCCGLCAAAGPCAYTAPIRQSSE